MLHVIAEKSKLLEEAGKALVVVGSDLVLHLAYEELNNMDARKLALQYASDTLRLFRPGVGSINGTYIMPDEEKIKTGSKVTAIREIEINGQV